MFRHDRLGPAGVFGVEGRAGWGVVDAVAVARAVVDQMEQALQIEAGVGVGGLQRDGDQRQRVSQTERPDARATQLLGASHQNVVVAIGHVFGRHPDAATQQVDLDDVDVARQGTLPIGEVLFAIRPRSLVGRAEQFNHGDDELVVAIPDFEIRLRMNISLEREQ